MDDGVPVIRDLIMSSILPDFDVFGSYRQKDHKGANWRARHDPCLAQGLLPTWTTSKTFSRLPEYGTFLKLLAL